MIKKYLTLAIALFLQMILINLVFGQVNFDETHVNYDINKMLVNVIELLIMLVVNMAIIYNFLNTSLDKLTLYFVIGLSSVIILLYWFVYKTDILSNYISRVHYNTNENTDFNDFNINNNFDLNANTNEDLNLLDNKVLNLVNNNEGRNNEIIFSKYHNKNTNRDFSFENSYPNYNEIEPSLENTNVSNNSNSNSLPDYSMYNGYDKSDICYNCKCIEGEDGNEFCAKEIPGMGRIGCSERWECLNCKDCQTWDDERFSQNQTNNNNDNDNRYTCQDCKCLDTTAGRICGRVSRVDGFVQKCSSECENCDRCYGTNSRRDRESSGSRNSGNYITIDPISNLNRVIVNNLKNSDLNDVLD